MLILALLISSVISTHALDVINEYRIENHRKPVIQSSQACSFARIRAKEASKNWSHVGFINRKNALDATGYWWHENLASDFDNAEDVLEGWKESPTHNKNLLRNMKYGCVARYKNVWAFEAMESF